MSKRKEKPMEECHAGYYVYNCPKAASCKLKKKCRILTTAAPLPSPIPVLYLCPAAGRDENGKKREVEIVIGLITA